jgi:hypothetical protein
MQLQLGGGKCQFRSTLSVNALYFDCIKVEWICACMQNANTDLTGFSVKEALIYPALKNF